MPLSPRCQLFPADRAPRLGLVCPQRLSKRVKLVRDAVRMIRELRVDELPVVDTDGKPIGLIDIQDLIALKVVRD